MRIMEKSEYTVINMILEANSISMKYILAYWASGWKYQEGQTKKWQRLDLNQ
jgi:hypothetical protein